MNKYAISDYNGNYLFDIQASSSDEALAQAKISNKDAWVAKLIALDDEGSRGGRG